MGLSGVSVKVALCCVAKYCFNSGDLRLGDLDSVSANDPGVVGSAVRSSEGSHVGIEITLSPGLKVSGEVEVFFLKLRKLCLQC